MGRPASYFPDLAIKIPVLESRQGDE
jgi:hypothetical protein